MDDELDRPQRRRGTCGSYPASMRRYLMYIVSRSGRITGEDQSFAIVPPASLGVEIVCGGVRRRSPGERCGGTAGDAVRAPRARCDRVRPSKIRDPPLDRERPARARRFAPHRARPRAARARSQRATVSRIDCGRPRTRARAAPSRDFSFSFDVARAVQLPATLISARPSPSFARAGPATRSARQRPATQTAKARRVVT